jgi:hypothetical protein
MQHAVAGQAALGTFSPMANSREARLNRIARADALLMLCRKIVEGHQLFVIFLQAQRGLRVLRLIRRDK